MTSSPPTPRQGARRVRSRKVARRGLFSQQSHGLPPGRVTALSLATVCQSGPFSRLRRFVHVPACPSLSVWKEGGGRETDGCT